MMSWSARPFVRILVFLIPGILTAYWFPIIGEIKISYLIIILGVTFITAFLIYKFNQSWSRRWILGVIFGFSIFITGTLLTNLKQGDADPFAAGQFETYTARLVEEPVASDKTIRSLIEIRQIVGHDTLNVKSGKAIAYFTKDSVSNRLQYGDMIIFSGKLNKPGPPKNPGEFNYSKFLALNNIYYTVFVSSENWQFLGVSRNTLLIVASKVRKYLLNVLKDNGISGNDYAVAAAILLGYDQLLESELEQNYVTAGAMHILCVSGLHVGIIFLVLNFMLGYLNRNKIQRIIKMIILLSLIWFYALLTGLSPSVQRASLMISLFIIASNSAKQKDVFNTLAASAVILLFLDPFLILNVGFQLSYSAVLGILLFYRPIAGIFYIKNAFVRKVWEIMVVSAAAQIGTFPLAAHYFHFFPTYFWLTNIFIFPLSFAIVGAGMLLMAFSWLPVISKFIGLILSGFVYLLNLIVDSVKFLPYNGIHDLYFPWFKVLLVYMVILLLIKLVLDRKIRLLLLALVTVALILLFDTIHTYHNLTQKRIVVYSVKGHSTIDFINSNDHVLLLDSSLLVENEKLEYHIGNSRISWGLSKKNSSVENEYFSRDLDVFYDGQFGAIGNKRFMRIDENIPLSKKHGEPLTLDFIIISGKEKLNIQDLQDVVKFNYLVIDSSVPFWKQQKLIEQAELYNIKYFSVSEEGAFIAELKE